MSRRYGLLILVLALVGCKTAAPQIHETYIPVYKYIAVPAQYTAHVDIAMPMVTEECGPLDTVCEMRQVAYKRKLGLQQCNKQLDEILFIQGTTANGN